MANQIATNSKIIGGTDYGFGHPAICRLSSTVMLAAHINESDELEIHKSVDDGLNWTLKKTLFNASGFFNLIFMSSTKVALTYQKNSNEYEVWVSTDSGDTWTNKLDITLNIGSSDKAILLYDNDINRLHIFWHDNSVVKIKSQYSDNDGDSWSSVYTGIANENIDNADIDYIDNDIYITRRWGTGTLYIVERDSSGTWQSTSANLGNGANYEYHDINLAIDSIGNRYLIYIERHTVATTFEKLVVRKNEGAITVLFNEALDNCIVKGSTSIGIDEGDNVFVYYTKISDEKTYYRKYDTGTSTWETEVELIGAANNRINCEKHLLALSNKLHFVYYQAP